MLISRTGFYPIYFSSSFASPQADKHYFIYVIPSAYVSAAQNYFSSLITLFIGHNNVFHELWYNFEQRKANALVLLNSSNVYGNLLHYKNCQPENLKSRMLKSRVHVSCHLVTVWELLSYRNLTCVTSPCHSSSSHYKPSKHELLWSILTSTSYVRTSSKAMMQNQAKK